MNKDELEQRLFTLEEGQRYFTTRMNHQVSMIRTIAKYLGIQVDPSTFGVEKIEKKEAKDE